MHKRIVFRGSQQSVAIENYINKHIAKIEKFLAQEPSPIYVDVTVEQHDIHKHHRITLQVKTPHYNQFTEYECSDVFVAINEVIDRMYRQLRQEKTRFTDNYQKGCSKECRNEFYASFEEAAPEDQD